jgi:hypothetical protein
MDTNALILVALAHVGAAPVPALPAPVPVASAELVGVAENRRLVVRETRADGSAILTEAAPGGRRTIRSADLGDAVPAPPLAPWIDGDVTFVVRREAPLGGRRSVHLEAVRGAQRIDVWRIPEIRRVDVGPLYVVDDRRTLVIAYGHGGRRGLELVSLRRVRAALHNLAALELYARRELDAAAEELERAVIAMPEHGDAIYNLACIHALGGDLSRAKDELAHALEIDPARYRALARSDADLRVLRDDPDVAAWLRIDD